MNNQLTVTEVRKLTGATNRQIHYWTTKCVIEPIGSNRPGTGTILYYDETIIPKVALLVKISKKFPNVHTDLHKVVYDHFDDGFVDLSDGITLEWTV